MMAGIVSKTEVLFLRILKMGRVTNTQRATRNGAGEWRYDHYLVLYINGEKTRVKIPIRNKDGLTEKVVKINNGKYFFQYDTERSGR